jgi:hypothetical protein
VHDEARMVGEAFSDFFPIIRTDMIAGEMNRTDVGINFHVQRFQKGDASLLPLAFITVPTDLARTGVKGRKEIQSPGALVLMLAPVRNVLWLGGLGWMLTRARL